jgi:guanylate kinase
MTDSDSQNNQNHNSLLIVISGPSGVGKDSVLKQLKNRSQSFHFVVTVTNREPRLNETDGIDYIFVSHEEFHRMIDAGELLEHALVYGEHKGIPRQQVLDALESGRDVILRIDVQGAETIRRLAPQAVLIFLTTSSEEELHRRLDARKSETPEALKLRIATAYEEFKRVDDFDYIIVNRDNNLDETVDAILAIIQAEHHRVHPRKVDL